MFLKRNSIGLKTREKCYWIFTSLIITSPLNAKEFSIMKQGEMYLQKKKVNAIKKRDIIKYQLCQEYGISIYYVKYDENVEESINKLLLSIKTQ